MIKSREELNLYMMQDMQFYHQLSKKDRIICWLVKDPAYEIYRYLRYLRKEEYYSNCSKGKIGTLLALWFLNRKNCLGNKLGFKIPKNTFGPGLTIYHHGGIIINENVRIGANAKLHGNNCIGNNGKTEFVPLIGDYLDLGYGANIIGVLKLGDNVTVGSNAIVTKTFNEDNITLVGIPAKKLSGGIK